MSILQGPEEHPTLLFEATKYIYYLNSISSQHIFQLSLTPSLQTCNWDHYRLKENLSILPNHTNPLTSLAKSSPLPLALANYNIHYYLYVHFIIILMDQQQKQYFQALVYKQYGLKGNIKFLGGFTDKNYKFTDEEHNNRNYLLKITSALEDIQLINLQNIVLQKLQSSNHNINMQFSRIISNTKGEIMFTHIKDNQPRSIRLFSYIQGTSMWELQDLPESIFQSAGQIIAKLLNFLSSISTNETYDLKIVDDISKDYFFNIATFKSHYNKYHTYLDEAIRQNIERVREEFIQIEPVLLTSPKQIIHNDICASNILVDTEKAQPKIVGLIDFGDLIYSHKILQLAIACARINLNPKQPLRNLLIMIRQYNKINKLSKEELHILFPLIKIRLAYLCLMSSFLSKQKNDDYFIKCKQGHITFFLTIYNAATNEQFILLAQKEFAQTQ